MVTSGCGKASISNCLQIGSFEITTSYRHPKVPLNFFAVINTTL